MIVDACNKPVNKARFDMSSETSTSRICVSFSCAHHDLFFGT